MIDEFRLRSIWACSKKLHSGNRQQSLWAVCTSSPHQSACRWWQHVLQIISDMWAWSEGHVQTTMHFGSELYGTWYYLVLTLESNLLTPTPQETHSLWISTACDKCLCRRHSLRLASQCPAFSLDPNSLIFSFSSSASPAHNAGGWAGYHYVFSNSQQIFITNEPNEHDVRRVSVRHTPLQKSSFGCCAIELEACLLALRSSLRLSGSLLCH